MPLAAGTHLGPYEVLAPLGSGGMGEVYRAHDARLGRDVAVKVLTRPAATAPDELARFDREGRAVAALSHPNVVAIYDIGIGDTPFLVTELLEGETLRAVLQRDRIAARRAVDLMLQLLAGLTAAHDRGLVHRDLKPENMFITKSGQLKILDFGLATEIVRLANQDEVMTRPQTQQGIIVGTIAYMAPEQVRGLGADQRSDIFACGAVLFEMLTGRRAFGGASPADTMAAILTEPPEALEFGEDTAPALADIVRCCLAKDAARRYQTARELASALEAVSVSRLAYVPLSASVPADSVAVLPFDNLTAEPANDYLSDGLSEDLLIALARLSGMRVASRTSSFRYRGKQLDVRSIGRELGVGAVVEGSVRRAGDRLRVSVELTNVEDGYLIWSQRYDRQLADVFDVQDEIVQSIVSAIAPTLTGEAVGGVRRATENPEAYDLYLRGRHLWNQRSPTVFAEALGCFEQAIAQDPDYALAYAGLADCYSILRVYGWTPREQSQGRALEAVTRALALDPTLPEAHFAQALYSFYFEPHWRRARRYFEQALRLSPRTGMFEAYLGLFLATEYRYDEADRHFDRALALEPHSPLVHFLVASAACAMGRGVDAERYARHALALQPDALGPRWPLAVGLLISGRHDDAVTAGEHVVGRTRAPLYLGVLGMVYGRAGRLGDARRLALELSERASRGEYVTPAAHLSLDLGLDDMDGIRSGLAACADGGAAPFSVIATDRWLLDRLRGAAEIDALLERLHDGAVPERRPA